MGGSLYISGLNFRVVFEVYIRGYLISLNGAPIFLEMAFHFSPLNCFSIKFTPAGLLLAPVTGSVGFTLIVCVLIVI